MSSCDSSEILSNLIAELRYLETLECRSKMSEEDRIKKRQEVTDNFKKALMMRNFFNKVIYDDLYN
jgi:hypothetical protein